MDKGKRIKGTARLELASQLKAAYESGASIRTLAGDHGRSYGFVHRMLTEAGVILRHRGGPARDGTQAAGGPGPGRPAGSVPGSSFHSNR